MSYRKLVNYFRDYVLQPWSGLESFALSSRAVLLATDQVRYPQLQMDPPRRRFERDPAGMCRIYFDTQVVVLIPTNGNDDWEGQTVALEQAEKLADQLINHFAGLKQLRRGWDPTWNTGFQVEMGDENGAYGWAVPIELGIPTTGFHEEVWQPVLRFLLTWNEGVDVVALDVNGENFQAAWDTNTQSQRDRALKDIVASINASASVGVTAGFELGELWIRSDDGTVPDIDLFVAAHTLTPN